MNLSKGIKILEGKYIVASDGPKSGAYADVYEIQNDEGGSEILKIPKQRFESKEWEVLQKVNEIIRSTHCTDCATVPFVIKTNVEIPNAYPGHIESKAVGAPIREFVPNETQALRIAVGFAELLRTCAENDIAYLDIKPEQHIFWSNEPWQVTVIDWNVAKLNASAKQIRHDLLGFCSNLPAIFTGKAQYNRENRLHPLEWNPIEQKIARFGVLSYPTWRLLASTSLTPAAKMLPALGEVLCISKSDHFEENRLKEQILVAWEEIIGELTRIINFWENEFSNDRDQSDLFEIMDYYSILALKKGDSTQWKKHVYNAESVAKELRKDVINEQKELSIDNLRHLRLLQPQDIANAVAIGAFSIGKGIGADDIHSHWVKMTKWALDSNIGNLYGHLKQHEELLREEICSNIEQSNPQEKRDGSGKTLADIWEDLFTEYKRLVEEWVYLEKAKQTSLSLDERQRAMKKLLGLAPNHPIPEDLRSTISNLIEVEKAIKNFVDAVDDNNLDEAARWLDNLRGNDIEVPEGAHKKYEELKHVTQLTRKLNKALNYWDKELVNEVLLDLFKVQSNWMREPIEQQLSAKIARINQWELQLKAIKKLLTDWPSFNSDPSFLIEIWRKIGNIRSKFPDAPDPNELQNQWKETLDTHLQAILVRGDMVSPDNQLASTHNEFIDSEKLLNSYQELKRIVERSFNDKKITQKLMRVQEILRKDIERQQKNRIVTLLNRLEVHEQVLGELVTQQKLLQKDIERQRESEVKPVLAGLVVHKQALENLVAKQELLQRDIERQKKTGVNLILDKLSVNEQTVKNLMEQLKESEYQNKQQLNDIGASLSNIREILNRNYQNSVRRYPSNQSGISLYQINQELRNNHQQLLQATKEHDAALTKLTKDLQRIAQRIEKMTETTHPGQEETRLWDWIKKRSTYFIGFIVLSVVILLIVSGSIISNDDFGPFPFFLTATPTATPTPRSTFTATPTSTTSPTATPSSTPTPTPTLTPIPVETPPRAPTATLIWNGVVPNLDIPRTD